MGTRTCCPRQPSTTRSPGTRTKAGGNFGVAAGHHHQRGPWCPQTSTPPTWTGTGMRTYCQHLQFDDKIAWYENLGSGTFGAQQVITTNADGASMCLRHRPGRRRGRGRAVSASTSTTRSPGTRTWGPAIPAPSAPSRSSPPTRMVPGASTPRTWTATAMRTCCPRRSGRRQDRLVREPASCGTFGPQQVITTNAVGA